MSGERPPADPTGVPPDARQPDHDDEREAEGGGASPRRRADTTAAEETDARGSPAASAAPTATAPRVRGRRRRLGLALVILVLGSAAVAGVAFLSGEYRQERAFQREAERVLVQLSDGSAEDVYESASPRFQQTLIVDKFVDLVARMRATLGRFVRVTDVIDVEPAVGVAGMTARVVLELEFERGTTLGALSFHRAADGAWRLLGFGVETPAALQPKAAALEVQAQRQGAPPEVIALVHSMLQGVREGRISEVHGAASPLFKGTVSIEGFQTMLQAHHAQLGNFVRVLGVVSSARNPDRDRARVQAILEYEKGKTTGTFEFIQVGGEWRLLNFKIVIPFAGEPVAAP